MLTFPTKVIEKGTFREKLWNFLYDKIYHPCRSEKMRKFHGDIIDLRTNNILDTYFVLPSMQNYDVPVLEYDKLPELIFNTSENKYARNKTLVSFKTTGESSGKNEHLLIDEECHYVYMCYKTENNEHKIHYIIYSTKDSAWHIIDKYIDEYNKSNSANESKNSRIWLKVILNEDKIELADKMSRKFNRISKFSRYVYKFFHTIDAIIMCIRFPFLYTRNRWTDRHYNNWKLMDYTKKLYSESIFSFNFHEYNDKSRMWEIKSEDDLKRLIVYQKQSPDNNRFILYYLTKEGKNDYELYDKSHGYYNPVFWVDDNNVTHYAIYDQNRLKWMVITDECVNNELTFEHNDYKTRYGNIVIDRYKKLWADCIQWFHKWILGSIFIIPTYCELDALDEGWRRKFGIDICKDLRKQLWKERFLFKYRIVQIKEKFGGLRWYDSGSSREVADIIRKYEDLSYHTCIHCGKPAKYITSGWICPYCEDCVNPEEIDTCTVLDKEGNVIKKYRYPDEEDEEVMTEDNSTNV